MGPFVVHGILALQSAVVVVNALLVALVVFTEVDVRVICIVDAISSGVLLTLEGAGVISAAVAAVKMVLSLDAKPFALIALPQTNDNGML